MRSVFLCSIILLASCCASPRSSAQTGDSAWKQLPEPDEFVFADVIPTWDEADLQRRIVYPEVARRNNVEGKVIVRVLLDTSGSIAKYHIGASSGSELLDSAAIDAIMGTRFTPARHEGKPIPIWVQIPFDFSLVDPVPPSPVGLKPKPDSR